METDIYMLKALVSLGERHDFAGETIGTWSEYA